MIEKIQFSSKSYHNTHYTWLYDHKKKHNFIFIHIIWILSTVKENIIIFKIIINLCLHIKIFF